MSTLADHLRALPDEALCALVDARPDLTVPVPADFSALAVRAQSRLSVARALDDLDRFTLEILDATRLLPEPRSLDALLASAASAGADPAATRAALATLRERALVFGTDHALHVVAAVDDVVPYPAGLGRPAVELGSAVAELAADPARLRRTVLAAPPASRAVLDRLAAGPPLGSVTVPPGDGSPVRWLLDHDLLVLVGDDMVELPREVAILLRRDTGPLGALHPQPPELAAEARDRTAADRAGAGQAMEAVRRTEVLLEAIGAEPVLPLRSGGLGVRDLRRLARTGGVEEAEAALLLEVAHAAGLLGEDDAGYLPTGTYDGWLPAPLAQRWRVLAVAWLALPRSPALVGSRDDKDRVISALSPEVERVGAPGVRRAVLAELPPCAVASASDVAEVLAWRSPRRHSRSRSVTAATVLSDAAALGLTGLGVLTSYAELLLAEVDPAGADADPLGIAEPTSPSAAEVLDRLLPPPVDTVLLQADLTVVVPGPPEPALAAELALVADVESASVRRVTAQSVRRALDAGYAADDLHKLFARRSRTPVPQALSYLVDDVARRHGGLRTGSASAYLRSDDEALIAQATADRRLAGLGLRRLAPTVLVSPYPPSRVLSALREAGYAPVPEDSSGAAVLSRPKVRRAPARGTVVGRREDLLAMPRPRPARTAAVVEQMRHGDAAARAARRAPVSVRGSRPASGQAHTEAMATLQQALRDKQRVWVGYVDAHGAPASRLLRPVSMGAGYLRAEDDRTETVHTFALHRITAAELES